MVVVNGSSSIVVVYTTVVVSHECACIDGSGKSSSVLVFALEWKLA